MLVVAHTGHRPALTPELADQAIVDLAAGDGHDQDANVLTAAGPALAELMPCSRVTTCGIGPNPALSPARSRPAPARSRQGAACHEG
jgi:hypothetical protein